MTEHKPLYIWSLKYAIAHNERIEWQDSYRENCDCARAIERRLLESYDFESSSLNDCSESVIETYGFNRVNWVLANTIQQKDYDGRFSRENKEWAKQFFIPSDDIRWHFCVESHPGLTDIFTNQVRDAWQSLNLFDKSHCTDETEYEGKLLVMKPTTLKDEFKTPDFQLFYAIDGFGCSSKARGRKIFGCFLKDGEKTSFNRDHFYGVIKDEHLPDWAREKLNEITGQDESEDITLGGIK